MLALTQIESDPLGALDAYAPIFKEKAFGSQTKHIFRVGLQAISV